MTKGRVVHPADDARLAAAGWQGVGPRWLLDRIRRVQRPVNRVVVRVFAGRLGPYAVVRHVGRRSGRQYQTPVVAFARGGALLVPLPYSWDVDWIHNLQEAGGGELLWKGRAISVGPPEIVETAAVFAALPPVIRLGVRILKVRQFLRLYRPVAPSAKESRTGTLGL